MKTHSKLLCVVFGLLLAVSVTLACIQGVKTGADAEPLTGAVLQVEDIAPTHYLNSQMEIPQGTFSYDGEIYDAEAIVHFPSGNAYKMDKVVLSETGTYTLEYRAVIDGKLAREYKSFEALKGLYTVGSSRSSMVYGKPSDLGIPFTTEQSPSGLCVSLASGDEFSYSGTINLNDCNKDRQAIRLYLTPEQSKAVDAYNLYVKFTDAYDPNNYVIVSIWSYSSKNYTQSVCRAAYITTCVPSIGQGYTGHYHTYQATNGGWRDVIWKNMTTSGFCSFMSFYGDNAGGDFIWNDGYPGGSGFDLGWGYTGQQQLAFWWDYDERQIWSNQPEGSTFSELLSDFDSAAYYSSLWEGFTTGECYVSLWAENYNNSSFNFVVTEVDGVDFSESVPLTTYKDETAPQITVNYGNYTEANYPDAKVGCAYPLFKASAVDGDDGETKTSARVFYGYGTDDCYEISCSNSFIPDREGDFTILYTAKDKQGNKSTKTVTVTATSSAPELTFSADVENAPKTGVEGLFVDVASATYGGGVGALTYKATATHSSGRVYEVENDAFRPMEAGDYEILCRVTDAIGQEKSASYSISVAASEGPVFKDVPMIPAYLIAGYDYVLPTAYATAADGSKIEAQISISDGGSTQTVRGGRYTADGETRTIDVVYSATANGATTDFAISVSLVNVNTGIYIDSGKYFVGNGFATTTGNTQVAINAIENATSSRANYINPVLAEGFSSVHQIVDNGFEEFSMYLTDSVDKKQVVKFSWKKVNGISYTYVNDMITTLASGFDFTGASASNFTWSNKTCVLSDKTTNLEYQVTETLNGEAFNGFTSGKIYVSYEMLGINGAASYIVKEINNQPMRSIRRDVINAQANLVGNQYDARVLSGTKITIRDMVAADVLAPNATVTLTITGPDGKAVKNTDGIYIEDIENLKGTFIAETAGNYNVVYTVSDGINAFSENYVIVCELDVKITINLNSGIDSECAVGNAITVPGATGVSSSGGAVTVYILYVDTTGVMRDITTGKNFTVTKAGTYRIVYTAYDEYGNVGTVYYDIIAK